MREEIELSRSEQVEAMRRQAGGGGLGPKKEEDRGRGGFFRLRLLAASILFLLFFSLKQTASGVEILEKYQVMERITEEESMAVMGDKIWFGLEELGKK